MSEIITLNVELNNQGIRLDKYISESIEEYSRSSVQKLMDLGKIKLNGVAVLKSVKTKSGDIVEIEIPDPVVYEAEPENIPLDIRYEDDDLLVVNKPKGMVVHPAAGNYSGTLVNALLAHCGGSLSGINGVLRPGIVHRIDKDTSGLLLVAKNDFAHNHLAAQIKEHSLTRTYQAVVYGKMKNAEGIVDAPIGRHPNERKQMAVTLKNSKNAVTNYSLIAEYKGFSHLKLRLETGRTHQIRVHMAYIGHPVAGDGVYGPKRVIKSLMGQCLHAKEVGFIHPRTEQYIHIVSELPNYFTDFLQKLEKGEKIE